MRIMINNNGLQPLEYVAAAGGLSVKKKVSTEIIDHMRE